MLRGGAAAQRKDQKTGGEKATRGGRPETESGDGGFNRREQTHGESLARSAAVRTRGLEDMRIYRFHGSILEIQAKRVRLIIDSF